VAPPPAAPEPQRHAVLVGINEYDNSRLLPRLQYAANDAVEMARLLVEHGYQVTLLTDRRPSRLDERIGHKTPERENVVAALDAVTRKFKKGDTLLVALAGHGLQV